MVTYLVDLPVEAWHLIATHLVAADVLSFLSVHSSIYRALSPSPQFWALLNQRFDAFPNEQRISEPRTLPRDEVKHLFLQNAQCEELTRVKWSHLRQNERTPSAREGHLCCVLRNKIVVVGGFTNDDSVYIKDLSPTATNDWESLDPGVVVMDDSHRENVFLETVYGASMTLLPGGKALRFGGFRSGGYSMESQQVALLSLSEDSYSGAMKALWELPRITFASRRSGADIDSFSRAYHSATLLRGRYLLIIGGMKSTESVLDPIMLDTFAWKWMDTTPLTTILDAPSPRHGHSVIYDEVRDRLVLAGGGSGSDLLRSGYDNSEVFELKLNTVTGGDIQGCLPFLWKQLHPDQHVAACGIHTECELHDNPCHLHTSETLVLGRCHVSHRVSHNKAVYLFGSGKPSTNGALFYDLARDKWIRPKIDGPLPMPRMSPASVYIEREARIFIHGGFIAQGMEALASACFLDIAPERKKLVRDFGDAPFSVPRSHPGISDQEAWRKRNTRRQNTFEQLVRQIGRTAEEQGMGILALREMVLRIDPLGGDTSDDDVQMLEE